MYLIYISIHTTCKLLKMYEWCVLVKQFSLDRFLFTLVSFRQIVPYTVQNHTFCFLEQSCQNHSVNFPSSGWFHSAVLYIVHLLFLILWTKLSSYEPKKVSENYCTSYIKIFILHLCLVPVWQNCLKCLFTDHSACQWLCSNHTQADSSIRKIVSLLAKNGWFFSTLQFPPPFQNKTSERILTEQKTSLIQCTPTLILACRCMFLI